MGFEILTVEELLEMAMGSHNRAAMRCRSARLGWQRASPEDRRRARLWMGEQVRRARRRRQWRGLGVVLFALAVMCAALTAVIWLWL